MESSAALQPGVTCAGKVRILLQTVTHLVPGGDGEEKIKFIKNMVCQRHWNRDFDHAQERMFPYGDDFDLRNRNCFFLIDHHGYDHTAQEEKVPVVWYKWTGESVVRIREDLPARIQKELKKWPFAWEGRKRHGAPKGPERIHEPMQRRRMIELLVCHGFRVDVKENRDFLKEYPEHAQWLETHLEPGLRAKIEPFCALPSEEEN